MASQAVYVDLDLKSNAINALKAAVADTDAPNWGQVKTEIGSSVATSSHPFATSGTGIAAGLSVTNQLVAVDTTWLSGQIGTAIAAIDYPVDAVTGASPITVDNTTTPGTPIIGIDPLALDFPVDSVDGTAPIVVTDTAGAIDVSLDVTALVPLLDTAGVATDAELSAIAGTKANSATAVTAGAGLTGGGTLAAAFSIDITNTDGSIEVGADGIEVADGGLTAAKFAYGAVDNLALGANLYALVDVVRGSTDPASATSGSVLTFNGTQWVGQLPASVSVPVTDITGAPGQIVVTDAAGVYTIALDPAITGAISANSAAITQEATDRAAADALIQADVDANAAAIAQEVIDRGAGDTAINTRIDAITVTGTGAATVTEPTPDNFVVHVESLQLANTYTGIATDSAGIDAEIAPALAQPGDLYVNSATGQAFIYDGDSWTELAAATAAISSIASADGSIAVQGGTGPATDLALSAALQTAISTSTTTNGTQDTAIAALQTTVAALDLIDHVAAVSGNAGIAVDAATQAVSVITDPVSTELTVGAAGLTLNLAAYATDADLAAETSARTAADTALQVEIDAEEATRLANDNALDVRIDTLEASQIVQNTDIDAVEAVNVTQDGKIAALEAKHITAPFVLDGTASATVIGPAGAVVTVRDDAGCIITISVCEAAGTYTLNANSAISGTISFG